MEFNNYLTCVVGLSICGFAICLFVAYKAKQLEKKAFDRLKYADDVIQIHEKIHLLKKKD